MWDSGDLVIGEAERGARVKGRLGVASPRLHPARRIGRAATDATGKLRPSATVEIHVAHQSRGFSSHLDEVFPLVGCI